MMYGRDSNSTPIWEFPKSWKKMQNKKPKPPPPKINMSPKKELFQNKEVLSSSNILQPSIFQRIFVGFQGVLRKTGGHPRPGDSSRDLFGMVKT